MAPAGRRGAVTQYVNTRSQEGEARGEQKFLFSHILSQTTAPALPTDSRRGKPSRAALRQMEAQGLQRACPGPRRTSIIPPVASTQGKFFNPWPPLIPSPALFLRFERVAVPGKRNFCGELTAQTSGRGPGSQDPGGRHKNSFSCFPRHLGSSGKARDHPA